MKIGSVTISRGHAAGAAALLIVAGGLIVYRVRATGADPGARSRVRVAIDAESQAVFTRFKVADGDTVPWRNPRTRRRTLYPAEKCFWTRDGRFTPEPTYVLLNEYVGVADPTICPDCGRVVVAHNPLPSLADGGEGGSPRDR
ncbi:MAG: hypothetical protein IH965_15120 [Gemmatimonadetes bacterium]|nr:hypothetical protein [Gemmatimonadota bacterium]